MGKGSFLQVAKFQPWPYKKKVFVMSSSLKELDEAFKGKVELLATQSPRQVVEELKARGLTKVYVDGGAVVQSFIREGLVNEITLTVAPILLGEGIRMFGKKFDTVVDIR